jgi:hypothetical protein
VTKPVYLDELLRHLHQVGTLLAQSSRASDRTWGRHLLEDWRSLELLGETQRTPETVEIGADGEARFG